MSDYDDDEAKLHSEPSAHVPQDVPQDNVPQDVPQEMAIKEDGKQDGRDPTTGQFIAGWKGGGRKKGSKDKLNQQVIATMEKLWSQRGEEIMDHLADTKPEVLAGLVARLIPQSLAEEAIQGVDSDEISDKPIVIFLLASLLWCNLSSSSVKLRLCSCLLGSSFLNVLFEASSNSCQKGSHPMTTPWWIIEDLIHFVW